MIEFGRVTDRPELWLWFYFLQKQDETIAGKLLNSDEFFEVLWEKVEHKIEIATDLEHAILQDLQAAVISETDFLALLEEISED